METPTPLEIAAWNPHGLDFGDRVVLPDGRLGKISKTGFRYTYVDVEPDGEWKGAFLDLRPYSPSEAGIPRTQQLSLLELMQ
jgi:hypothetical protein